MGTTTLLTPQAIAKEVASLGIYLLDEAHASTGGSPSDATSYIQGMLDACAAAGGGTVLVPLATFFFTLLEVGDNTILSGHGPGSTLKQLPGITYNSGGTPTGSYGVTSKTNVNFVGFTNLTIDGNASASTDAATNFSSAFVAGVFTPGQYKCGGLAIDRLNRGTLIDGTWVSPTYVYADRVWSVDGVRDPFLFQMNTNRSTPGFAQCGYLYARDSAVDHLFYAAESETVHVAQFEGEGHWNQGAMALSGGKFESVSFTNLTANPWNNTTHSFKFDSGYCIDDRADIKNSVFSSVSLYGDLALLGGPDAERCLFRTRGLGATARNVQIEHTGTDVDMIFRVMIAESATAGGSTGGTVEGPSISGLKCRSMPSQTRLFTHDPSALSNNLLGGSITDVYMTIAAGALAQASALFEFKGSAVAGFGARNVYVETEDFATSGPSAIYENASTGSFTDVFFEHVVLRRSSSANAAFIDNTTTAANVVLSACHTFASSAPSRQMEGAVEAMRDCVFGTAKYNDSRVTFARKTTDQSVTSSTTLANDSALFAYGRVSGVYEVEVFALVDADVTGALKVHFTGPSGATVQQITYTPPGPFVSGTLVPVYVFATYVLSSTAGFLQFQFAQGASSATATTMKAGSWLRSTRVS